jgi:hypothetical protein
MDNRDDGCLPVIAGLVFVGGLMLAIGYNTGHKNGVKDHAAGRYVVVQMPDGTEQVCKVKEPK